MSETDQIISALVFEFLSRIDKGLAQVFRIKTNACELLKTSPNLEEVIAYYQNNSNTKIVIQNYAKQPKNIESTDSESNERNHEPASISIYNDGLKKNELSTESDSSSDESSKAKNCQQSNHAKEASSNKITPSNATILASDNTNTEDSSDQNSETLGRKTMLKKALNKSKPDSKCSSAEKKMVKSSNQTKYMLERTSGEYFSGSRGGIENSKSVVNTEKKSIVKIFKSSDISFLKKHSSSSSSDSSDDEKKFFRKNQQKTVFQVTEKSNSSEKHTVRKRDQKNSLHKCSSDDTSSDDSDISKEKKMLVVPIHMKGGTPDNCKVKKLFGPNESKSTNAVPCYSIATNSTKSKPSKNLDTTESSDSDKEKAISVAVSKKGLKKVLTSRSLDNSSSANDSETTDEENAKKLMVISSISKTQKSGEHLNNLKKPPIKRVREESDLGDKKLPKVKKMTVAQTKESSQSSNEDSSSNDEPISRNATQNGKKQELTDKYENFVKSNEVKAKQPNISSSSFQKNEINGNKLKFFNTSINKGAPFRRVRTEEVEIDDRVKDMSFEAKKNANGSWGDKANRDLKFTRGKSFKHEKTKKKRGSYRGGHIDMGVNSIKFD